MSCSSGVAELGGKRQSPLRELQKGLSSQGRRSLAAGEVWLLRERLFSGGVLGTKGVEVIHRTEQLQKKNRSVIRERVMMGGILLLWSSMSDCVLKALNGEFLGKKQCLASFRRASRVLFAWLGLEGLLVVATTAHSDSANFQQRNRSSCTSAPLIYCTTERENSNLTPVFKKDFGNMTVWHLSREIVSERNPLLFVWSTDMSVD